MKRKNALRTMWQAHRPGVDAVLSFANMKIENAGQVERALSHAAMQLPGSGSLRMTLGDGVWGAFSTSVDRTGATYRRDQDALRGWLKKIVNWKKLPAKERLRILSEIKPWTELGLARVKSEIVGDRLERVISYDAINVQNFIGEVMYQLFEWGMAQEGGIAVCPECQNYFVRDRTDQKVCSNRCRQRQYRRLNEVST